MESPSTLTNGSASKAETAQRVADAHALIEPSVLRVIRYTSRCESDPNEPIKIVEVNDDTIPAGIVPIYFGPTEEYPFPLAIIEVTSDEFERIGRSELTLPDGWESPTVLRETNGHE